MTITGLENNYYLAGNDIWVKVSDFPKVPVRLELKATNTVTGKTLPVFRLYPDLTPKFQFNISQVVRPLQPYPDHIDVNTLQSYELIFTVVFDDSSVETTTLNKEFIRGGRSKNNISEWYLSDGFPLVVGKWVEWRGVNLPGFAKKIMGSLVVDFIPTEANTYRMINYNFCNAKIIKFRNSLGGYQFWVFETYELQPKVKAKDFIAEIPNSLRGHTFRNVGTETTEEIVLKTKTPAILQEIIIDLINSPDVMMYDSAGTDEASRWQRLQLSSTNDAVYNSNDMSYINEISYQLPNYVNRDL